MSKSQYFRNKFFSMVSKIPIQQTKCLLKIDGYVANWLARQKKFSPGWESRMTRDNDHSPVKIISKNGATWILRRVIADAFLPGCKKGSAPVCINKDELDLRVENLEWMPLQAAMRRMRGPKPTTTPGVYFRKKYTIMASCHGKEIVLPFDSREEAEATLGMLQKEFTLTDTRRAGMPYRQ